VDQDSQQDVAGIAVHPLRTGGKVERHLADLPGQLILAVILAEIDLVVELVGDPRGMREQMADFHVLPVRGRRPQILVDRVVEPDFSVADQEHHQAGGELLADRARLENRVFADRHVPFEIRESVAADPGGFSLGHDRQGEPRNLLRRHRGSDRIVDRVRRSRG